MAVKHGRGATVRARETWNVLDAEVLGALLAASDGDRVMGEVRECQRLVALALPPLMRWRPVRSVRRGGGRERGWFARSRWRFTARSCVRRANGALARLTEPLHAPLALARQADTGGGEREDTTGLSGGVPRDSALCSSSRAARPPRPFLTRRKADAPSDAIGMTRPALRARGLLEALPRRRGHARTTTDGRDAARRHTRRPVQSAPDRGRHRRRAHPELACVAGRPMPTDSR